MVSGERPAAYVPALDGLRAVSILLVVLSHMGLGQIVPGAFGVTLFFFVSGYLITRQLLPGIAPSGWPDFGGFYLRRVLRLAPQLAAYVAVAGLLYIAAGGHIFPGGWAAALFYGANYYDLWWQYGPTLPGVRHPFNILWSLSIEEHFYLVWPIVLAMVPRRGAIPACLMFCAAILIWRFWLLQHCFVPGPDGPGAPGLCAPVNPNPIWRYNRLYLATDTRADSIAWGAILALAEAWRPTTPQRTRAFLIASGVLLLAVSFAWPGPLGRHVLRPTLQGLALLLCLPALLQGPLGRALSVRPMIFLGRLSYALYLWHWLALAVADDLARRSPGCWLAIALPLSALLTLASYYAIEQPMLRIRRRFGSAVPLTATAAASVPERQKSKGQGLHAAS